MLKVTHFTKADLVNLDSCFLDPKGNFITGNTRCEIGVHEELSLPILDQFYGERYVLDNYKEIKENRTYLYEYLEEVLGYFRFSHWVGEFGVFNGEKHLMTFAQKLAIREFCKVHNTTWEKVVQE